MGLGNFWIQSRDGKLLNLFNFSEVKRIDVEANSSFLKCFDFFDVKKDDGSSGSDQVLNREELISIFSSVAETANNNGKSVFNVQFANEYINQTKLPNGKTLKELDVSAEELIDFLSMIVSEKNGKNSLNELSPEQQKHLSDIKKNQGYSNLSEYQQKFILEAVKNNIHMDSIIELIKNKSEDYFNEQTLNMFKKALADKDLDVKYFGVGLTLSLLNEVKYKTAKEIFINQQREDKLDLLSIAELTLVTKQSDLKKLSYYISTKFEPHNINFNATTIEYIMKLNDSEREDFLNIIKNKNIPPKYYSRIAQLTPVYQYLPKDIFAKHPEFVNIINGIEGTVGFSPNNELKEKYFYLKTKGLYEIRKRENNSEIVINNKTNTITRTVYKDIPGYQNIVESEVIERYDSVTITDTDSWQTGNLVTKTVRKLSDVEGVYNTSEIDAHGNQKPLEFGSKDKDGNVYVEKNYTSPGGVKTQYSYERTVDGKVIMDYKISRKNKRTNKTELHLNRKMTMEHKGNGVVVTSVNGNIYEAEFKGSKLVITDKTKNERKELYIGKVFIDDGADIILNILQNVPANELMAMKKLPISAIFYNKNSNVRTDNNARWSETGKFIEMGHESRIDKMNMIQHSGSILNILLPTFIHEFGHYLDSDSISGICSTISKNNKLMELFKEELKEFLSVANGLQQQYIAYFIDSKTASAERNAQERVAEANTILNTLPSTQYANRASYLQQYFPRTIAKIAELIDEVIK